MDLTASDWIKVAGILVLVANMALSAYLFVKSRSTKATDELKATMTSLSAKIEGHESRTRHEIQILVSRDNDMDKRLSVIETRVDQTHGDLMSIKEDLSELASAVAAVGERSTNIMDMVKTIQTHLLEK